MRPFNFGAGPATLPLSILKQAQSELLDWQGAGMSVLEIGHRTQRFKSLIRETREGFRELLNIPPSHEVLLLGFPARFQFSMIPMNFLKKRADYIVTGLWSELAFKEANKKKDVRHLTPTDTLDNEADYVYFTPNETISGFALKAPDAKNVPLIADMTSCLLSAPLDVSRYALIFAGAQKNIAPPGLTVVIVNRDFLMQAQEVLDTLCDYRVHLDNESNYATPPNFAIYMANLMCHWLKSQGGLKAMEEINKEKARLLYQFLDESDCYVTAVPHANRSITNIVFKLKDDAQTSDFLARAEAKGLLGLKGHRTEGGIRASLYNAMPLSGVKALIAFMSEFASK